MKLINRTLSHEELIGYINKSKFALMPTRRDSQGVMTCEFMTFGIPMITSDLAVCREICSGFDNYILIDNENIGLDLEEKMNEYYGKETCPKSARRVEQLEVFREEYDRNGGTVTEEPALIVIAGNITSEFFVNEIPYFANKKNVYVVSFGTSSDREKEIIDRYHLKCIDCSLKNINVRIIMGVIRWLKEMHVKKEMGKHSMLSKYGFKRRGYVLWYGVYAKIAEMKLRDVLQNEKFSLYAYWLSRPAYIAAYIKKHYENNCIYSLSRAHRYDLYEDRNPLKYLPFREFIGNTLDEICFISRDGMDYYKERIMPYVSNTLFLQIKRLGTKNPSEIVKKIRNKESIMIVSCSSVIEVKRLDLIIKTIQYLQSNDLNVKWLHIGQGELIESMKRMAKESLIPGSYKFVGYIKNSEILHMYWKCDADFFINLSDSEGVPVSIMEAISIGLPVIARNVGGNSEIVDETNGCLLNDEFDTQTMKRIQDFVKIRLNDIVLYKEKSSHSRERWEKDYNADKNYTQFFENFQYKTIPED